MERACLFQSSRPSTDSAGEFVGATVHHRRVTVPCSTLKGVPTHHELLVVFEEMEQHHLSTN